MALLTLKRGNASNLKDVPIVDGQLLITGDLAQIYLDNYSARLYLGGGYGLRSDAQTIRIEGDSATYYPVRIQLGSANNYGFTHVHISRRYNSDAPDNWHTGSNATTHPGGLTLSFRWTGDSTWGGNDKNIIVDEFSETYSNMCAGLQNTTDGLMVWLRGGGADYQLSTDYGMATVFEVHYETYTASNGVVITPRTDLTNVETEINNRWTNRNSTLYSQGYLVLSANNYTSYTVSKTGSGASGTWGINISGNANTATTLATARTFQIADNDGTNKGPTVSFNGSTNAIINLPSVIKASLSGNASSATKIQNGNYSIGITSNLTPFIVVNGSQGRVWGIERYNTDYQLYEHYYNNGTYETSRISLNNVNYSGYALPLSGGTLTGLLTITTNNRYVTLGCQNQSFAHYSTNADSGHWFNTNVRVQGDIYCGNSYDKKVISEDGGYLSNQLISHSVNGGMWISGTHSAAFVVDTATSAPAGNYYQAWYSGKTPAGAWSLGCLAGDESMYFVYGSDADFQAGTNNTAQLRMTSSGVLFGAAWNDYAEFRQGQQEYKPGTCVIEVGDDTLVASTERLQGGALIVSDTFGFAIGETDEAKTPIATSGRVLAYTFEPRESYSAGDPVCSGPNGTVSKMTEQEVMMYPHKMIGTVSAIPDYEEWGTGKVKVDGRIWIQVR